MATNKKIRINYEGKEYTLEFTKNTVRAMQANGFDISKIDTSPNVVIPDLFAGAFRKNHPFIKADVLADIYANLKGKAELISTLAEMYSEPAIGLFEDPEESEKKRILDDGLNLSSFAQTSQGAAANAVSPLFYSEKFEELCPYYMSYGMTYDEYWNGDNYLPRYYRKAYQIKREQADSEAWLQGRYIYDALLAASPVFNALSKKKEPLPYVKQPYLQDVVIPKEETKEEKERKQMQTQRQLFEAKVIEFNAKFLKRKEAEKNGGKL